MALLRWTCRCTAVVSEIPVLLQFVLTETKHSCQRRRRKDEEKQHPRLFQYGWDYRVFSFASLRSLECRGTALSYNNTAHPNLQSHYSLTTYKSRCLGVMAAGGVVAAVTWRILLWVWNHLTPSINLSEREGPPLSPQQAMNKRGLVLIKICGTHVCIKH